MPLDVEKDGIDLLSLSGHKIYGPKGIGAIYIRKGVTVVPLVYGGGQEKGVRPGTVATPLCVGLGEAARLAQMNFRSEKKRILGLRTKLLTLIQKSTKGVTVNGDLQRRLPGNLSLSIEGVDIKPLLESFKAIAISASSACTSDKDTVSYVIRAIDPKNELPPATLRISVGRFMTEKDIEKAAAEINAVIQNLREKNPEAGKRACKTEGKLKALVQKNKA